MALTRRTYLTVAGASLAGSVVTAGCSGSADTIELTGGSALPVPVAGNPDADVTVAAFTDFACSHCRTYHLEVLPELEAAYLEPGDVRYEHRDFPVPVDNTWSWAVAGAARSVQEQAGDPAFWSFANESYERQDSYSAATIEEIATDVGVDGERTRTDAMDGVYRSELDIERRRASDAGVRGTPTITVDGTTVDPDLSAIETAIDAARD